MFGNNFFNIQAFWLDLQNSEQQILFFALLWCKDLKGSWSAYVLSYTLLKC
jgi:hypothetical protein